MGSICFQNELGQARTAHQMRCYLFKHQPTISQNDKHIKQQKFVILLVFTAAFAAAKSSSWSSSDSPGQVIQTYKIVRIREK